MIQLPQLCHDFLHQALYNHRAWLLQCEPDRPFACNCSDLPGDRKSTGHIAAPAATALRTPVYD